MINPKGCSKSRRVFNID